VSASGCELKPCLFIKYIHICFCFLFKSLYLYVVIINLSAIDDKEKTTYATKESLCSTIRLLYSRDFDFPSMQEQYQGQNEITKDIRYNNVQQVTRCTLDATFENKKGR
jgi:hypothetical protein